MRCRKVENPSLYRRWYYRAIDDAPEAPHEWGIAVKNESGKMTTDAISNLLGKWPRNEDCVRFRLVAGQHVLYRLAALVSK